MATAVKDKDYITADGDYEVTGLIAGRTYIVGLFYESGTGTMAPRQKDDGGVASVMYENDNTTQLTITASKARFQKVYLAGDTFNFNISSASSLVAKLRCFPVPHGY